MTGLDLGGIHARYEEVLRVMNQRKCSLAKAMEKCGVARNTLRGFIGICELKILDQDKFNTVVSTERERGGKPSVKDIEQCCRVADFCLSFLKEVFTVENDIEQYHT